MRERPTPEPPNPGKRRPPRAPSCHPHSAPSQHARALCLGVWNESPHPQPPAPQPVGSGPSPHAPKDGRSGVGERPTPDAPHPGKRRPPRDALVLPPKRAKPARKSARCGVGDRCAHPHPPHPHPMGSGPWKHAPKDGRSGLGERQIPDAQVGGAPPLGILKPPPQGAKPARKSARGGVGDGSPRPHPPHPQPVASGPRPHARKDEWSTVGERPTPEAPHPGRRRPPRAPSCHPHSAQGQLAGARAVGLVMGPHACTPRTHSQWVVGPGCTPERTSRRGWEGARPRTPHTQEEAAPPRHPRAAPTARKASSQECSRWGR